MKRLCPKLSYANVISTLALVLAVGGGTAYAASSGGSVIKSPNANTYAPDSIVMVTANANEGYVFEGWRGDSQTLRNPLKLSMNGDKQLTATFAPAGIGVIIDNMDPEVQFEPQAAWIPSPQAFQGTRYLNHHSTPANAKSRASAKLFYRCDMPWPRDRPPPRLPRRWRCLWSCLTRAR